MGFETKSFTICFITMYYLGFMMTFMCFTIRQILETFARSHDMFVSFSLDLFTVCLFESWYPFRHFSPQLCHF